MTDGFMFESPKAKFEAINRRFLIQIHYTVVACFFLFKIHELPLRMKAFTYCIYFSTDNIFGDGSNEVDHALLVHTRVQEILCCLKCTHILDIKTDENKIIFLDEDSYFFSKEYVSVFLKDTDVNLDNNLDFLKIQYEETLSEYLTVS